MAAVKIQYKNCLQSTLRKKKINTLFAGLGRSVLGKTVPSVLSAALGLRPRAVLKTSGTVFPNTYGPPGRQITYIYVGLVTIQVHACSFPVNSYRKVAGLLYLTSVVIDQNYDVVVVILHITSKSSTETAIFVSLECIVSV